MSELNDMVADATKKIESGQKLGRSDLLGMLGPLLKSMADFDTFQQSLRLTFTDMKKRLESIDNRLTEIEKALV